MNGRFGEDRKRKRLVQTSIEESFKRHRSNIKSKVMITNKATERGLGSETTNQSYLANAKGMYHDDGDVEIKKKRALLADAAEKRRDSALSNAATSYTSSDTVVEGGSKDGLSDTEESVAVDVQHSPLLFPNSPSLLPEEEVAETKVSQKFVNGGSPIQSLNRFPECSPPLPPLLPQPDHTVLVRSAVKGDCAGPPEPSNKTYRDKWDRNHVRMPCSRENLYPVENSEKKVQNRWELIEATLLRTIKSSVELQDAILKYNAHYSKRWNFEALHSYFNEVLDSSARAEFFDETLPGMVTLALCLPTFFTEAIPLLKRQQNHTLTMSQEQAACLLANAFFCTFPRRNSCKHSEYSTFPDINFNRLFQGGKGGTNSVKTEKLQSIFHYFRRVIKQMPTGTLTFQRQVIQARERPQWERISATFGKLHVSTKGTIEDNGTGFLQVDFANKFIGGGVIGEGCVQEEIRFLVCPELILSRLFSEQLDDNECLLVTGAERFSDYIGYAHTFRWSGNHVDQTPRDSWGRRYTKLVAIDAHIFRCYTDQFEAGLLQRELDKAYCGFHSPMEQKYLPAIATGNWGCGAFGGDSRVKGLIQLMASATASRDLVYFTFGDAELAKDLLSIHSFITEKGLTVGDMWNMMRLYGKQIRATSSVTVKFYSFIRQLQELYDSDTDEEAKSIGKENEATMSYNLDPDSELYIENTP